VDVVGLTVDVPVSDLAASVAFYAEVLGRAPDLRPAANMAEWILHRDPELAIRLVVSSDRSARLRVGIGVADIQFERDRLAPSAELVTKPGIISTLQLEDPDGHQVVLWQDLMRPRPAPQSD